MSNNLESLKIILGSSPAGHVIVDSNMNLIYMNNTVFTYFGMPLKDYVGKKFGKVFNCTKMAGADKICEALSDCSLCEFKKGINSVLKDKIDISDVVNSHKYMINNEVCTKWFKMNAISTQIDDNEYAVVSLLDITDIKNLKQNIIDITESKEIESRLKYYYYHDDLTGLYNRRYINEQLEYMKNIGDVHPLSIIIGDVNGLKIINDAFGRSEGDNVIKKSSFHIRSNCDSSLIVGKWGGDEFIILIPNSTQKDIQNLVNKIKTSCKKEKDVQTELSLSFGFATKKNTDVSIETVLNIAEDMMLKNKTYESASFRGKAINMILDTLHVKNEREEEHSRRVSEICVSIGNAMDLSDVEISKLRMIGLVHDIGKIGIDEDILNKKGKLTQHEWEEIKKHPAIGYRILSLTNETSELAQCILCHHERLDGKGYPNGISGDSISVMARILSIADSYDAMTSKRTYRPKMSQDEAINELLSNADTQFDSNIVDIFINKVASFGFA